MVQIILNALSPLNSHHRPNRIAIIHRHKLCRDSRIKVCTLPVNQRFIGYCVGQVWSWDITWLPPEVRGHWFYLYMIPDLYSRKITGYEVHETESGEQAAALLQRSVIGEGCWRQPMVLHADNGVAMKSQTLQMKLHELNITPSRSRPRGSNDNAYGACT